MLGSVVLLLCIFYPQIATGLEVCVVVRNREFSRCLAMSGAHFSAVISVCCALCSCIILSFLHWVFVGSRVCLGVFSFVLCSGAI